MKHPTPRTDIKPLTESERKQLFPNGAVSLKMLKERKEEKETVMKRFISFSAGVESTTMCVLYGKGATAIWCDTGAEENEMYARIDLVEQKLKELHEGDFELKRIRPSVKFKEQKFDNLEDYAVAKGFAPSKHIRYCTTSFKIEPIDDFLCSQGECELMIGFNADESPRYDKSANYTRLENVQYSYPLHEEGYTREDCESILNAYGLNPSFPIYMQRGGCRWCFFQGKKEMKAKCIFSPAEFARDKAFEIRINESTRHKRKKFFPINQCATYQQIEDEVNREISMWGIDAVKDMYKKIEGHKPCGAFCHR